MRERWGGVLALGWTMGCGAAAILGRPLAQPLSYHQLADQRTLLGVPGFANVLSNVPFLVVGLLGLRALGPNGSAVLAERAERLPYVLFFLAVTLVFFGSSYYHLAPDNARLVWDRLPISAAGMALVGILVADRVSPRLGSRLVVPAVLAGLATVWYWRWSAARGVENLTPYLIVQLYGLVMVLLLAALFPPRYTHGRMWFGVVAWYVLGKLCEFGDRAIYAAGGLVSGHTLKHLLSGVAVSWVLRMLVRRRPLNAGSAGDEAQ